MVNEVGKLIYNALVKHHAVYLPEVGSLRVVRRSASMGSKSELIPPRFEVEYTSDKCANSLIDIISNEVSVDAQRADEIYSRWLDKAREGSEVVIDRVGVLHDKSFTANQALVDTLNGYTKPIRLQRRVNSVPLFVTLIIVLLVAAGATGWWYLDGQQFAKPVDILAEDVNVPVVETPLVEIIEEPEVEIIANDESSVVEVVEEVSAEEVCVVDWRNSEDIRHWVVVGSYSTTENAERAISDIVKRYPESQCDYFKLGSMYAVAIFGSVDLQECQTFKSAHTKDFPQSWIYTPKKYR